MPTVGTDDAEIRSERWESGPPVVFVRDTGLGDPEPSRRRSGSVSTDSTAPMPFRQAREADTAVAERFGE